MKFGIREIIFLLVLLAVPVLSAFYLFKPRNEDIRQTMDEINIKRARLETLEQITGTIDDLGLAIEEGRDRIEMIEAKLPSEELVAEILEQIWQLASRNKMTLKGVKSDKPVPAAAYQELPLNVTMEGDFNGFYQFLLELESLPRITRIHTLDLTRADAAKSAAAGSASSAALVKAEFTLSIYFESDADGADTL
jgi:type IV pilus assembly protein PilO